MVAGCTYEEAVEAIFGRLDDGSLPKNDLRTTYVDLIRGLRKLKVPTAPRQRLHRNWEAINGISIVKCGLRSGNEWHWVVYDGRAGDLYDPLRDEVTKPDGRTRKISSHLPVWRQACNAG